MNISFSPSIEPAHTLATRGGQQTADPDYDCIHRLFEIQAERTPDAVALICDDARLSYGQLNRRANQFAQHLRGLGVGPDVRVGVCVERSLDLLVGLLGILKAGGAYVPLDPAYPQERLAFMLEDAQVPLLVTQAHLSEKLAKLLPMPEAGDLRQIVRLDADWPLVAGLPAGNLDSGAAGANLAYMIYTSGSTGRPKGVLIEHAGVCNELLWRQSAYPLSGDDRVLHTASLSFDIAVWELFGPLLAGAQIVLAAPGQQHNTAGLIALILRRQITIVQLPTSLLRVLLEEPSLPACERLRHIFCGGDALTIEIQQRCFDRLPGVALHNLYGPTEATIEATFWDCRPDQGQAPIPIGWPIANKQIYILDRQLAPVPPGTPGELYIGGAGLARGYLGRPDLTAERFVPNPFARIEDRGWKIEDGAALSSIFYPLFSRLYRTGDLARYRPDGAIEFLGRVDHQVKVRGFRIELGEIEAALLRHPMLHAAVVLAREDTPGLKRLVAYVVPAAEDGRLKIEDRQNGDHESRSSILHPLSSELRAFLHEHLPDYMTPSLFVVLDALPLTPNGKIDRAALPIPSGIRAGLDADFAPAASATEVLLAQLWAAVLGLDQVGIHDNFFELGGDSILSIQLISRARQAGLRIAPKQLFDHPTVAALAAVAAVATAVLAQQGAVSGLVLLTPIQRWFFEQNFAHPHHWNQAMLLEVPPDIDAALLELAFHHLIVQHDALRLCFTLGDNGWQQVNAPPAGPSSLARGDLSALPEPALQPAIEAAAAQLQSSLDLARAPRMCAMLLDFGAERAGRLLIVINYLAIDGVSWRILLEDLQTVYEQLRQGQAVALPPKTTSYQQWGQRLSDYTRSDALQRQLPYWLDEIRSSESAMPLDMPNGANTVASARSVSRRLTVAETRALLQEVPKTYQTQINDVLLAALLRAWAGWAGSRSLLITLESHGREDLFEDVDLSRTVGWFTSFFPVLLQQEGADEPRALLTATKERLRRIPNHGISYGLLRYLSDDPALVERLRRLPRPQLRFNYLGQFDQMFTGGVLLGRATESYGPTRSPAGHRTHLLVAEGLVAEGRLHFTWTYSANLHHHDTIAQLADRYLAELRSLIEHCLSPNAGAFTPSDFQLAGLNQQQLDDVAALISGLDEEE